MWIEPREPGHLPRPVRRVLRHAARAHAAARRRRTRAASSTRWVAAQRAPAVAGPGGRGRARASSRRPPASTATRVRGTVADGRFGPDLTHLMSRETHRRRRRAEHAGERCAPGSTIPTTLKPGALMPAMKLDDADARPARRLPRDAAAERTRWQCSITTIEGIAPDAERAVGARVGCTSGWSPSTTSGSASCTSSSGLVFFVVAGLEATVDAHPARRAEQRTSCRRRSSTACSPCTARRWSSSSACRSCSASRTTSCR